MIKSAFGVPMMTKTWAKAWERLFAGKPIIYICVVLAATLVGFAYELRSRSIFSCPANGYGSDRYIAYCNGSDYGDYDHGAIYFDLEPPAQHFIRNADVLFLGNSRLQVAFSTAATTNWFSGVARTYYLLGFGYFENMIFAEQLLRRIRPQARVYVINIDDFFVRSETVPVNFILHDPQARTRYAEKRSWQRAQKLVCGTFSTLCGTNYAIFRSWENGAYRWRPVNPKITAVSYDDRVNQKSVNDSAIAAIDFLSRFTQDKCVILTMVPTVATKIANARAIATAAGMNLVTPRRIENLQTFDGSHLDEPSAERWSKAFFEAAEPKIRSCLAHGGARHS